MYSSFPYVPSFPTGSEFEIANNESSSNGPIESGAWNDLSAPSESSGPSGLYVDGDLCDSCGSGGPSASDPSEESGLSGPSGPYVAEPSKPITYPSNGTIFYAP